VRFATDADGNPVSSLDLFSVKVLVSASGKNAQVTGICKYFGGGFAFYMGVRDAVGGLGRQTAAPIRASKSSYPSGTTGNGINATYYYSII
jgi:hypothetical protein